MVISRISVAMATYNGEKYISEQLDSIIGQTMSIDEIVISDDASDDATIRIVKAYREKYKKIDWIILQNVENIGFKENFKLAIRSCTGDVIFLCDQDDVWRNNRVESIIHVFEREKDVKAVINDFTTIDASGKQIRSSEKGENIWVSSRVYKSGKLLEKIELFEAASHTQGQGCTTAISRSVADLYIKSNVTWIHDHLLNVIAAWGGDCCSLGSR